MFRKRPRRPRTPPDDPGPMNPWEALARLQARLRAPQWAERLAELDAGESAPEGPPAAAARPGPNRHPG